MNPWILFFISAAVIVAAGTRLTIDADHLSDALNLGKAWIGVILLGVVTSLPEAVVSLTSVISLNAVDLAAGNLLGSNNINPMVIVVMDLMYRQGSLTNALEPDRSHKASSGFAILLISLVIVDILLSVPVVTVPGGQLSAAMALVAICYLYGMRQLARAGSGRSMVSVSPGQSASEIKAGPALWSRLIVSAGLVVAGAIWLAHSSEVIARQTGLGETFFGSIFLAVVTSLPEIVVSVSALRLGSVDLAIGNIFGSTMTNIFILFLCGLFHRGGPIMGAVSKAHVFTAGLSIVLTAIAVNGIFTRNKKAYLGIGSDSWAMIVLFLTGMIILYQIRMI